MDDSENPVKTDRIGRIYKITCKVTNLCYVGKTIRSVKRRFAEHLGKNSCCRLLKNAIDEYGKDNFKIETLWEGGIGQLGEMEKYMIKEHHTLYPGGYNLTGGGGRGEKACMETKNRMINKQRKRRLNNKGTLGEIRENKSKVDGRTTSWTLKGNRNGKTYKIGNFKTKEEVLKIQDEFTKDPDGYTIPTSTFSSKGDAKCVYYTPKRNKWTVLVDNTYLGNFDTQEQAYDTLNVYKEDPVSYKREKYMREDVGVTYKKSRNKWDASIWKNGKPISLGHYITKEEAITARKRFIEDPESFVRPNQRKKIKI